MKTAKIIKLNTQIFLDDLKRAKAVMVYASVTDSYYYITKKDIISDAERKHIDYFMSENLESLGYTMIVR